MEMTYAKCANIVNALDIECVFGDGQHDDTDGLQTALDTKAGLVYFPKPKEKYVIRKTLIIYSGQTLVVDRDAVIQLADRACAHMLTNSDHVVGNKYITITGGIWDGNNTAQTCEYHENGGNCDVNYDPARYLGVLMQFNNVSNLQINSLTLKDPETFGMQLGNLRRFTIADITFDYNRCKLNMDGVHIHGNCHQGIVKNLKGNTNDDLLALNADDGRMFEMSRGPITDIEVDGIFAEDGYTAVRLLSAGSRINNIHLSNIYGRYRYYGVSFTHHDVHPGEASVFDNIVINGMFCAKSTEIMKLKSFDYGANPAPYPLIWVAPGTKVKVLHLNDIIREEELPGAAEGTIMIDKNAQVDYVSICNASVINKTPDKINLLSNYGTINSLNITNVYGNAEGGSPRGFIISSPGAIQQRNLSNVITSNFAGIEEDVASAVSKQCAGQSAC